ncbi:MAG: T9SS type A sorting domain-containing protein [Bacteroidia bacterium]
MRKSILVFLFIVLSHWLLAQSFSYNQSKVFKSRPAVVNFSEPDTNWVLHLKYQHSKHGHLIDKRKKAVDHKRSTMPNDAVSYKKRNSSFTPKVSNGFAANFTNGTPADNNMCISNDGIIMSAVNSNVRFYNENGDLLAFKTLASIARDAGNFSSSAYDPHTIYDPEEDRFILIFLSGYSSNNTNMIVGFCQSNDPTGDWNFYKLPGNVHGDNTWSDYPFAGITHDELFIPVLLWYNGESGWDSEAQEIIWQIDKHKGYAGQELEYKYYDKIKVANRLVWNTRPVWGSEKPYGPNMYLVANRAIDTENDSIFLFEITNTLASGNAELTMKVAKANVPYGIPPSAKQPIAADSLRTNYADIHGAILHYGKIHFVANSNYSEKQKPAIYYGVIQNIESDNPKVESKIFVSDTLDLNYPNIAYAGGGGIDRSFVVNCLHSAANVNPGSSVFFVDRNGDFSDLVMVKEGAGPINVMRSDQERWGDYTGAQRKYNENGVTWFMGSFGNFNNGQDSWLAKVENTDPQLSVPAVMGFKTKIYPNPVKSFLNLEFEIDKSTSATLGIYNFNGQMVKNLTYEHFEKGIYYISINTSQLAKGMYFLKLDGGQQKSIEKFIIE